MRSPKWIYQQFVAFEEQAAAIYLQMASRFSPENTELSSFWLDMGMQEKQHAGAGSSPCRTDAERKLLHDAGDDAGNGRWREEGRSIAILDTGGCELARTHCPFRLGEGTSGNHY